jgi:cation diffusion facilitator CzcD-associated flavoprotein CzcO
MITNCIRYVVYTLNGGCSKTVLSEPSISDAVLDHKEEAITLAKAVGVAWEYTYDEKGRETGVKVYEAAAHIAQVIKNQGRNPLYNQRYLDQLKAEAIQ